jgi:conjugal transfer pilus assembly protein TraK
MKRLVSAILFVTALPAWAQQLPQLPPMPKTFGSANRGVAGVPAQALPGIGTMPGERNVFATNVVPVSTDHSTVVSISATLPNRIATPFLNPKSIDNQSKDFDIQSVGQSLYVTMKTENSIALYVTGDKPGDPVISLTLVPKNLPAQTITLQLDKPVGSTNDSAAPDEAPPDSNVYTDKIRYVLREVALNKVPNGFSEGDLPRSMARMGDVLAYPLKRYSGPAYDIYRYRIEAVADNVNLDEGAFYTSGVRAVAFFPTAALRKGQSTEVYVVSDKPESE